MHFVSIFLLYFVQSSIVTSYPLSQFYPFNSAAGDNNFPANDDGSTSRIPVSVPFQFFGSAYSSIYVNNNGDVTFDAPLRQYNSQVFPINGSHKIIAPFWTDIDTRKGGYLWYRTTTDYTILRRGTNEIHSLFPGILHVSPTWMMVITWEDVAAFGCSASGNITCQQVGYNAGDGIHYYSVPGSMTDNMTNLPQMSNIGVPGKFVFRVDERKIEVNKCQSSPCIHGNCLNELNHYICNCEPGYTGINCQTVDILYLLPLIVGLPVLLLSILLLFLWKRYKRHCREEVVGVLVFRDVILGPSKPAFQSSLHVKKA